MTDVMIVAGIAIAALMIIAWAISVLVHDASIVDPIWGPGFAIVAWATALTGDAGGGRVWLIATLTAIWGVRLGAYLGWRNLGSGEDKRYQAMRRNQGPKFWIKSLATVFGLQGALMWIVSLPVQAVAARGGTPRALDWIGVAVWTTGLIFEATGDAQLARFKADPANKDAVMDRGLWRYTRHPNYFGDFAIWWGLYLIALAAGAWWTIVGPAVMTVLLMRISGAGLLEKTIGSRRPGYADYVRRTSAFFPMPSKRPA